jgi:hypothetical protein
MSEYVYIKSEPFLWTVGFYDPIGVWQPESDWPSTDEAAARAHWLNGEKPYQQMEKKCTELESRLSALENIIACDGIDARLHQPSALEQKPAETEREWMRVPKYNEECWVYYPDGEIHHGHVDDFVKGFTHIMPYRKGDKQPEPPVERGA